MENLELDKRIASFTELFNELQTTTSRTEKEFMVSKFLQENPDYKDDFTYIFETLDGKHPIGWTFGAHRHYKSTLVQNTIADVIKFCEKISPKTADNTFIAERIIGEYGEFIEPIVNRKLRLGIARSVLRLDTVSTTPMLAKKFEGDRTPFSSCYITEKLDGNRCIARYNVEKDKWEFYSRSGKPMAVIFDMSGLPREYTYDGEIMSVEQTQLSERRYDAIINSASFGGDIGVDAQKEFNKTSGMINRHDKMFGKLVYNIFDIIIPDMTYSARRTRLNSLYVESHTVRILPLLGVVTSDSPEKIYSLLSQVVSMGGEGVMLNDALGKYEHKRSSRLLKCKIVQTIDMMVTDILPGEGKYDGLCGALACTAVTPDGKHIICNVGSGLTDYQRFMYVSNPSLIVGRIIEVGYHEITQAKDTDIYSLRFPRFVKIRNDKNSTSVY